MPRGIERLISWLRTNASTIDPQLIHALPNLQELTQQLQSVINQISGHGLNIFYSTLGLPLTLLLLFVLSLMYSFSFDLFYIPWFREMSKLFSFS